jgi:hypothetical protein
MVARFFMLRFSKNWYRDDPDQNERNVKKILPLKQEIWSKKIKKYRRTVNNRVQWFFAVSHVLLVKLGLYCRIIFGMGVFVEGLPIL